MGERGVIQHLTRDIKRWKGRITKVRWRRYSDAEGVVKSAGNTGDGLLCGVLWVWKRAFLSSRWAVLRGLSWVRQRVCSGTEHAGDGASGLEAKHEASAQLTWRKKDISMSANALRI